MNELASFVGSVLFIVPSVYIAHKFFHLNKSIDQYTRQVKSLSNTPPLESSQPNSTFIHCQRCDLQELEVELSKVVIHQ